MFVESRGDFVDTLLTRGLRRPSWTTEHRWAAKGVAAFRPSDERHHRPTRAFWKDLVESVGHVHAVYTLVPLRPTNSVVG